MSVVGEAVRLARHGFAVMPVDPVTKRPMTAHGSKDASRDEQRVLHLFDGRPGAVVGIATGSASCDGHGRALAVVDVDPLSDGAAGLEAALANVGPLSPTALASTPSGGSHRYFRVPSNVTVRNSAGALAPGVDIRGEGGYVVAPPAPGREWIERVVLAELSAPWVDAICARADGGTPARDGAAGRAPSAGSGSGA